MILRILWDCSRDGSCMSFKLACSHVALRSRNISKFATIYSIDPGFKRHRPVSGTCSILIARYIGTNRRYKTRPLIGHRTLGDRRAHGISLGPLTKYRNLASRGFEGLPNNQRSTLVCNGNDGRVHIHRQSLSRRGAVGLPNNRSLTWRTLVNHGIGWFNLQYLSALGSPSTKVIPSRLTSGIPFCASSLRAAIL